LTITQKLAAANPLDLQAQRDLSVSYGRLGDATLRVGQTDAAVKHYQDALAIDRKLAAADPRDARAQRDLSVSYNKLGDVTFHLDQNDDALKYYREGLAIAQKLAVADSRDASAQRDVSISCNRLGETTLRLGHTDAALNYFQDGLAIREKLAAADPGNASAQRDLSISQNRLGGVMLQLGRIDAALKCYQNDLAIVTKLAQADPKNAQVQDDLKECKIRIAYCESAEVALSGFDAIDKSPAPLRAVLLRVRCSELARRGDLPGTAEAAERLRKLAGHDAALLYYSSCGYGLCVRILETPPVGGTFPPDTKPRQLTAEEKSRRQKYVDLALAALKDAVATGYHDADQIRTADDLATLRGLPEFQEIVGSIAVKGK
jgi:tetratricopeptide (TPR) repeat protein